MKMSAPHQSHQEVCESICSTASNPFHTPVDHVQEDEPVKPWRGISTECLPQELKRQLNPHWSDWLLADPEYSRYRSGSEQVQIFVRKNKNLVRVYSISEIELGQEHYVMRRKPATKKVISCSGAAKAPTIVYHEGSFSKDQILANRAPRDSISINNLHYHQVLCVRQDKQLHGEGPYSLTVSGLTNQSATCRLTCTSFETGEVVASTPRRSVQKGENIPWQDELRGLELGKYHVTASSDCRSATVIITIKPEQVRVCEVLYRPDEHAFFMIPASEYGTFIALVNGYDAPMRQLARSYASRNKEQVDQAKAAVDTKLKPLVDAQVGTSELVEFVGVRGKKCYYIERNSIQSSWHKYLTVRGGAESTELVNNRNSFDFAQFKKKLKPRNYDKSLSAKAEYKWNMVEPHSSSLGEWAAALNRDLADIFDKQDKLPPDRKFDYGAQAQVMRYSYGTSIAGEFDLKKREIDLSFKSESSLALAEGKIEGNFYWPGADGAEIIFTDTPTRGSRAGQKIDCNIGVFRFKATAELAGFAGASLQASAGLTFGMKEGKVRMRGSVKQSDNKDENYVGIGGEAFAGIKGTGSAGGAGEWQNPEKRHDWVALLELGVSATVAAGLSLEGSFGIDYKEGRFIVHFSGHAVAGVGGGGKFACTVGVEHIGSFLIYVYHQLKNEDFHFVRVIAEEAFDYYVAYRTYGLVTGEDIREMYQQGERALIKMTAAVKHKLETLHSYVDEQEKLLELHLQQQIEQKNRRYSIESEQRK